MLLPIKVDAVSLKRGYKRNLSQSSSSADGKIVFILLTEIITFHTRSSVKIVQVLGLKFVSKSTFWCLEKRLEEVIHILLSIPGNVRSQKNEKLSLGGSNKSFKIFGWFNGRLKSLERSRFVEPWGVLMVLIVGPINEGLEDSVSLCKLSWSLDWSHLSKQAGWSVKYGDFRIVKRGDMYNKQSAKILWDAQRDWIRYLAWGHIKTTRR